MRAVEDPALAAPSFPRCSLLCAQRSVLVRLWWPVVARHRGYLTSTWPRSGEAYSPDAAASLSAGVPLAYWMRCDGMDRTSTTAGCLLHHQPDAELTNAHEMNPPIYAALVAEWWVRGRIVPGRYDAQWATLAAVPTTGTPDGVEFGIGTACWERVTVARAGAG